MDQSQLYIAYLLRCWLEGSTWRYSLEEIGSGQKYGFATLDEFVSFLVARFSVPLEGMANPGAGDLNKLLVA